MSKSTGSSSGIRVLTPTGTLGYGFGADALSRGMSLGPDVISVDAGSTDPGPYYLGSGEPLVSEVAVRRELTDLLLAARDANTPLIVGTAGGAGAKAHVDGTAQIVRDIASERAFRFRLATIYADVSVDRLRAAIGSGHVQDFEAGTPLTETSLDGTSTVVAQMGHEPICQALEQKADVVIAGRACDDAVIAAFPIWRGADEALAMHAGKILECGAFAAEPFAMDVMLGTINADHIVLEPGSLSRRATVKAVAAHSLYEREDPFRQGGPGHEINLSGCRFEQIDDRRVRVEGAQIAKTSDYYVKVEGVRLAGYRSICIAGIRCPTTIGYLDNILQDVKERALQYFQDDELVVTFHVYGRNAVMKELEPKLASTGHEVGIVIETVAEQQNTAHAACHYVGGAILHYHYPGMKNTSGNLAFPYSPSTQDTGAFYEFSVYHLMKVASPRELFPLHIEEVG